MKLGTCWDAFRMMSRWFWNRFSIMLGRCREEFRVMLGRLWDDLMMMLAWDGLRMNLGTCWGFVGDNFGEDFGNNFGDNLGDGALLNLAWYNYVAPYSYGAVIDFNMCCHVVYFEWCWSLQVSHLHKHCTAWHSCLCINTSTCNLIKLPHLIILHSLILTDVPHASSLILARKNKEIVGMPK